MSNNFNSLPITSIASTLCKIMGIKPNKDFYDPINTILNKANEKFNKEFATRLVIYNPDGIALWLFQKYTNLFSDAIISSDISLPMLSVMPCVTPVCFASMYSGVYPEIHGIKRYEKPILKVDTVFDVLSNAGKKVAIISTSGDSISMIFLNRKIDYFIYDTVDQVNKKSVELIKQNTYDALFIYNGDFDASMHKHGPRSQIALEKLKKNISFYSNLKSLIKEYMPNDNTFYGFLPDHGCHEIDGDCGSHGLDMEEDMNIIQFFGFNQKI